MLIDAMQRVLVKVGRGNKEDRIGETAKLQIEVSQEVEQARVADQGHLFAATDQQPSRPSMRAKPSCGLELEGKALSEMTPDMDLEVAALVVGQRSGRNKPPVRGEDADLGELGLGDYALLDVRDSHLSYANRPRAAFLRRLRRADLLP